MIYMYIVLRFGDGVRCRDLALCVMGGQPAGFESFDRQLLGRSAELVVQTRRFKRLEFYLSKKKRLEFRF